MSNIQMPFVTISDFHKRDIIVQTPSVSRLITKPEKKVDPEYKSRRPERRPPFTDGGTAWESTFYTG